MEEDFVLGLTKKDKVILHEIEGQDLRVAPQSDQDVRVNPKPTPEIPPRRSVRVTITTFHSL